MCYIGLEKTSTRCQSWEPDQPSFLPPNLREWLSEDYWACFLLDLVDHLDFSALAAVYENERGGRPPYDVRMMAMLLLYAFCVGAPASRRIERAAYESAPFRVLQADRCEELTIPHKKRRRGPRIYADETQFKRYGKKRWL